MFTYPICPPPCRFNTTPRRLLVAYLFKMARIKAFQYTAARRRLETAKRRSALCSCFNTQPPEGGWAIIGTAPSGAVNVSTHSRPKAAGAAADLAEARAAGFNTQPPEGGWVWLDCSWVNPYSFNTQPPEGGWGKSLADLTP